MLSLKFKRSNSSGFIKPQLGTPINAGHQLSTGLDGAWAVNENGGTVIHDATGRNPVGIFTGTQNTWGNTRGGLGLVCSGGSGYVNMGTAGNFTSENFTIAFGFLNNSNGNGVIVYKGAFQSKGYYIQLNVGGGNSIRLTTNQASANQNTTTAVGSLVQGNYYTVVCTRNGATVRFYFNGIEPTYNGQGTHISPTTSSDNMQLTNYTGGSNPLIGNLYWYAHWRNRVLTVKDAQLLTDNSFCFYAPSRRRVMSTPASAAAFLARAFGLGTRQAVNRASTY